MNFSFVIKVKGWATFALGVIFLFAPEQVAVLMGATLGQAGATMTQLFGLVLIALGWALLTSPHAVTDGSKSLVTALADTAAVGVLLWAINQGVFGSFAYLLVAAYAISACIFFYQNWFRNDQVVCSANVSEQTSES